MDFRQYLLEFSLPSMSYAHCRAPPSSSVASCPFLLSRPFHKGHPSPPLAPKLPSTPGRTCCPPSSTTASLAASAPFSEKPQRTARGAPTRLRRESGHPSSEAGTAAPGPSHRKPPPPGARAAPRRTAPSPPRASRRLWPAPLPQLARRALRTGACYLPRPQKRHPTPLPLPPSTAGTRAGSRARPRSPDPEEAGRTRRCEQPRPGVGTFGPEKAFLSF